MTTREMRNAVRCQSTTWLRAVMRDHEVTHYYHQSITHIRMVAVTRAELRRRAESGR